MGWQGPGHAETERRAKESGMSGYRGWRILAGGVVAVGFWAAATACGEGEVVVADGVSLGSALSPTGSASGSTDSSGNSCLAIGGAVSLSGDSAVGCKGITTGSTG